MAESAIRLAVWTEGLGSGWEPLEGNRQRLPRDPLSPAELAAVVRRIRRKRGQLASGLFVLQGNGRQLHLALQPQGLEISDPGNANYQNVTVAEADLEPYLTGYFAPKPTEEEAGFSPRRKLEWLAAVFGVICLVAAVLFVRAHLREQGSFLPKPAALEIENPSELKSLTLKYAGVYVTSIDDGEMAIELKPDGTWAFYDMFKGRKGFYTLESVSAGTFKPAYESGQPAILTDTRFVFYPAEKDGLTFLDRRFTRAAQTRDEMPYLSFPGPAQGKPGS